MQLGLLIVFQIKWIANIISQIIYTDNFIWIKIGNINYAIKFAYSKIICIILKKVCSGQKMTAYNDTVILIYNLT